MGDSKPQWRRRVDFINEIRINYENNNDDPTEKQNESTAGGRMKFSENNVIKTCIRNFFFFVLSLSGF